MKSTMFRFVPWAFAFGIAAPLAHALPSSWYHGGVQGAPIPASIVSVLGATDWSDNFDSYTTGSQIHGQGGWKGWSNSPAAGALVSDAQSVSAPNAVAVVGATDLVHPFEGYDGGVWVLSAKQYIPSGFAGESYFIVQNRYNDAGTDLSWSTQVVADSAKGVVKNFDDPTVGGANPGSLPLVTGAWVDIALVIDLDGDQQSFYYNGALLFSGSWTAQYPFSPPNGAGTLTIGALDLFANDASVVYYDDIALRSDTIFADGFDSKLD